MKWQRLYKESNDSDFVIKNGVLTEYLGKGGEVVIPNGVTSIGIEVFRGYNITSVTIPNGVTKIGPGAFHNCKGLMNVTIPDSVTSIASSAFFNCYSLTDMTIPNKVTRVGEQAFGGCKNLKSITVKGKNVKEAKTLLEGAVDDISIVKGNKTFVVRFKYSHRTEDEQEFTANSPEEARRKFEKWAADMENYEDFDFEFIDAEEEKET